MIKCTANFLFVNSFNINLAYLFPEKQQIGNIG